MAVVNHLRLKRFKTDPDGLRPDLDFWGPAKKKDGGDYLAVWRGDAEGTIARPSNCPICSHADTRFVVAAYGWPIWECARCKVGFVWPTPPQDLLMRYYEQAYAKRTKTWMDTESVVKSILSRQAQCFDRVARRNIDMRVLDVGAGDGTMLRLLMDLGYKNALGIELSEEGSRQA